MAISNEIFDAYLSVSQNASRQFRLHFEKCNLTFPQALVLNALLEETPVPISVLAEKTGSANSTVSGIVDRLEKLGLVQRERSREDRRVIYVGLTDQYIQHRKDADSNVRDYFARLLSPLEEEEKQEILRALRKLDEVLCMDEEEEQ